MSSKNLKIAFIHPDLGIGGAERLILDFAGALASDKHEVRFITNHFDKTHAFDELKSNEYPVEVYGDWLPRSIFGRFQALCAYIRMLYLSIVYIFFVRYKDKPDLYFVDQIPVANSFLKLFKEKVVYYCHHPDLLSSVPGGALKKFYRKPIDWLEMITTAQADVILVNSEYTGSIFRKTFPQIKKSIQILYPTIAVSYQKMVENLEVVKPIESLIPNMKSTSNDKVIFLSINRFHPAKKLDLAIEAMYELKNFVSDEEWERIFLIMAGGYDPQSSINSETYEKLTELVIERKLEEKVVFLKSPSDNLKVELLKSCTCLIYTPVKEHFGIVPLEAMLVEKPVVAVNSGGPRETVNHGITGYLCEPEAKSMADFMCRIFREDIVDMGSKGRKQLNDKFSYESFKNSLRRVVSSVDSDKKKN